MARKPKQPRWYFSLRSPYSWFAYRELTEHYPDVLAAVEWLPYWEPDPRTEAELAAEGVELPGVPMSRAKNFYILQDTRRVAKARGWTMTWPIDVDPVWEVAHIGYLVAADEGRGREYVDAAYLARWERGENLSDPAVVAAIARSVGLDGERVACAHDDPGWRALAREVLGRGYRDGAFGVPFFVHGFDKFWGTERVREFVAAVRGVAVAEVDGVPWRGEQIELPELVRAGGDAGHAGGCG
ncbi:2-hydroxychromene-2-carboxylate isomerase [Actinokineospora guangxiensis]|uniref:2-hydroxychromene-2-carboxylate isomerase n=1 Tax=Actinokineospora guangxiensis TaxID=1490288 RepID=A0ABW0EI87_9PSEU